MRTNDEYPEIELFGIEEQEFLYQGLIALIQSGSPAGLRNGDRCHPVYTMKYTPESENEYPFDDFSPNKDVLYLTLLKLSNNLTAFGALEYKWFRPIRNWSDFQKVVSGVSDQTGKR